MKTRIFFFLFSCLFIVATIVQGAAPPSGIINGDRVNLRADPGPYGHIISVLQKGLLVAIMEQTSLWYKVQLQDGQSGWIYHQFIVVAPITPDTAKESFVRVPEDELITYAKSFLETKYIYGGDTPQGFDCSGFTKYVFAKFGISLPHEADLQIGTGSEVPTMEDLLPGDLVFFKTMGSATINHVGIYLGDYRFINASSGYGAVRISPLDTGYYYNCYAGGRRLAIPGAG